MARPGLTRHRKFAQLALAIGDEVLARGHLEYLWEVAYENGDDLIGPPAVVEHLARWKGEPGKLSTALVAAGFLDESDDGLRVHDLWDHAPDYVRKRRERERERTSKGKRLSGKKNSAPDLTGQCPPNGAERQESAPNGRTRSPSPSPSPTQQQPPAAAAASAEAPSVQTDPLRAGAADAAAVLAGRVPQGKAAALAARYPLTARVAQLLEAEWDEPPAHPAQAKRDQVERDIARIGVEHAADVCFEEGERVIERGGEPPRSMGFFADLLASAKPRSAADLPPRGPRENPRPGDPDFNDPDAWWDYEAYLRRDAGPARSAGVAHA